MGWARHTHATVNSNRPRSLAVCDLCGRVVNHDTLRWNYQWVGPKLQNLGTLRCEICVDVPQQQLRTILIPPDPIPIQNPRPGEYGGMQISSSPDYYQTIVPNNLAVVSTNAIIGQLTTESSIPLITEINITPTSTGFTVGTPST